MNQPSPYQARTMGVSLVEYYRRLLIAIVRKNEAAVLEVAGADLLNVQPEDGLLLRFSREGVTLRVESDWEAHVGTPGRNDPASWIAPDREQLQPAKPSKVAFMDDARATGVETTAAKRKAVRQAEGANGDASGTASAISHSRVPWYSEGSKPQPVEE